MARGTWKCIPCRQSKQSCNRQLPCNTCKSKGEEELCVYGASTRRAATPQITPAEQTANDEGSDQERRFKLMKESKLSYDDEVFLNSCLGKRKLSDDEILEQDQSGTLHPNESNNLDRSTGGNPGAQVSDSHEEAYDDQCMNCDENHPEVQNDEVKKQALFPRRLRQGRLGGANTKEWIPRALDIEENMKRLLSDPLINAEVEDDGVFRNLARMRAQTDNVYLKRSVKPTTPPSPEEEVFPQGKDQPKQLGRQFVSLARSEATEGKATLQSLDLHFKDAGQQGGPVIDFSIPRDEFSDEECSAVERDICDALDRSPCPLDMTPPDCMLGKGLMLKNAVESVRRGRGQDPSNTFGAIRCERANGGVSSNRSYRTAVRFFEPSGKVGQIWLRMNTKFIRKHVKPCAVPAWLIFKKLPIPDDTPLAELPVHQKAIGHLRFLQWSITNSLMSEHQAKAFYGSYVEFSCALESAPVERTGPYEGYQAFSTSRQGSGVFLTRIRPSKASRKDIGSWKGQKGFYDLPEYRVYSIAKARVAKVLSIWTEGWRQYDFLRGWVEAARAADAVNFQIDEAEITDLGCNCSEDEKPHVMHECNVCSALVPCDELRYSEEISLRCCKRCLQLESSDCERGRPRMMNMLRQIASSELKRGGPQEAFDRIQKDVTDSVYRVDWSSYRDAYSTSVTPAKGGTWPGKVRKFTKLEKGRVSTPFDPSVDAARPFFRTPNGDTGLHVPGNLFFTAGWLNYAQNIFVKGTGPVLADYVRNSGTTGFDRDTWDDKIREIHMIAVSTPYLASSRVGQSLSEREFALRDLSWRTLRLAQREKVCFKAKFFQAASTLGLSKTPPRIDWRPSEFERLQILIEELIIQARSATGTANVIQLRKAKDGCPYPFDPAFMPEDWSWWNAWRFFSGRFWTGWLLCNGRYIQKDTPETLFLTCLWEYCSASFCSTNRLFKIPINIWPLCPIRLSIGRIEPGKPLASGWCLQPTSVADWDRSRCNMSIETCFENWAKHNYHPRHYQQIRDELLEISLPLSLYDAGQEAYQEVDDIDQQEQADEVSAHDATFRAHTETALAGHLGGFIESEEERNLDEGHSGAH